MYTIQMYTRQVYIRQTYTRKIYTIQMYTRQIYTNQQPGNVWDSVLGHMSWTHQKGTCIGGRFGTRV